jgi:hypothetical protein
MGGKFTKKNRIKKNHKPHLTKLQWGLLCFILIAISSATLISFGAYTYQNNIKSVVSTKDANEALFYSNHLQQMLKESTTYTTKLFSVDTENIGKEVTTQVRIYNYDLDNVTIYNTGEVNYIFKVEVLDGSAKTLTEEAGIDSTQIKVNGVALGTDYTYTLDKETLTALQASYKAYSLQFPTEYVGKISFKVTATPLSDEDWNATGNKFLGRILSYSQSGSQKTSWSGRFSENDLNGAADSTTFDATAVQKLDGFNYDITGRGTGTITLSWNTKYITISPLSLQNLEKELESISAEISYPDGADQPKISFPVGGENQASRYTFQFYRVMATDSNEQQDENGVITRNGDKYVEFEFSETKDE